MGHDRCIGQNTYKKKIPKNDRDQSVREKSDTQVASKNFRMDEGWVFDHTERGKGWAEQEEQEEGDKDDEEEAEEKPTRKEVLRGGRSPFMWEDLDPIHRVKLKNLLLILMDVPWKMQQELSKKFTYILEGHKVGGLTVNYCCRNPAVTPGHINGSQRYQNNNPISKIPVWPVLTREWANYGIHHGRRLRVEHLVDCRCRCTNRP